MTFYCIQNKFIFFIVSSDPIQFNCKFICTPHQLYLYSESKSKCLHYQSLDIDMEHERRKEREFADCRLFVKHLMHKAHTHTQPALSYEQPLHFATCLKKEVSERKHWRRHDSEEWSCLLPAVFTDCYWSASSMWKSRQQQRLLLLLLLLPLHAVLNRWKKIDELYPSIHPSIHPCTMITDWDDCTANEVSKHRRVRCAPERMSCTVLHTLSSAG